MIETPRCELTTLQSCDRDLVVKLYTDAEVLKGSEQNRAFLLRKPSINRIRLSRSS